MLRKLSALSCILLSALFAPVSAKEVHGSFSGHIIQGVIDQNNDYSKRRGLYNVPVVVNFNFNLRNNSVNRYMSDFKDNPFYNSLYIYSVASVPELLYSYVFDSSKFYSFGNYDYAGNLNVGDYWSGISSDDEKISEFRLLEFRFRGAEVRPTDVTGFIHAGSQTFNYLTGLDENSTVLFIKLESGFVTGTPTPEPATWMLMIAGFGAIGAVMRKRHVNTTISV